MSIKIPLIASTIMLLYKCNNGILSINKISEAVMERSADVILEYEKLMYTCSFDKVFELLNIYLRDANKDWAIRSKINNLDEIVQLLTDSFHIIRTAAALFHPITPVGCDIIREYLNVDERLWDWEYIFEPLPFFVSKNHMLKFLKPRTDFFRKHDSQF